MLRYKYSNPTTLAMTIAQNGKAVYGPGILVWYYEAEGESPYIQAGTSTIHPFVIRWATGDCNLGEPSFQISYEGEPFRDMTVSEVYSGVLRSGIYTRL